METRDYEWFVKTDLSEYAGEWVATLDQKVVTHGDDAEIVYKEAKAKYPTKNPSLSKKWTRGSMAPSFRSGSHGHWKKTCRHWGESISSIDSRSRLISAKKL